MIHTATQSRLTNYGKTPPVRVKHVISCSYGDCCMMSICEWGRARLEFEEDINDFDDQDHMDHVGEFNFSVNETFLSCDHNIFMVAPAYTDA